MKQIFEKIKEKLEELKLIDVNCRYKCKKYDWSVGACDRICNEYLVNRVNEIIDQVEEEYKNGWILCEVEMPKEKEEESVIYDSFDVTEITVTEKHMVSDLVNVTIKHSYSDEIFVCDDCTVDGKWCNFDNSEYEVLAWQPLPEPYQPK